MFGYRVEELSAETTDEKLEFYRQNIVRLVVESDYQNAPQRFLDDAQLLRGKVVFTHTDKTGVIDHMIIAGKLAEYKGRAVFHLGLSINLKLSKGKNSLAYFLFMFPMVIRFGLPMYFTCITNSPRVFGTLSNHYSEVYPSAITHTKEQDWHRDLAKIVRDKQLPGLKSYDKISVQSDYIISGMMGDKWDREIVEHHSPEVNKSFYKWVDPKKGQCIIQVGKCDAIAFPRSALHLFLKNVLKI